MKTKKLYDINAYQTTFEAKVVSCIKHSGVGISDTEKENELYDKYKKIEEEIKLLNSEYEKICVRELEEITGRINKAIRDLNSQIYGNNVVAPELSMPKHNKYYFGVGVDNGTGTNVKNLILLDLASLALSSLPVIAHDTILFKHIALEPMSKIIELYTSGGGKIMMNLNITQDNLYLLLPSKISWLAMLMVEDKGVSITEAIETLYKSDLYKQLEKEETKLWHLGPVALYESLY